MCVRNFQAGDLAEIAQHDKRQQAHDSPREIHRKTREQLSPRLSGGVHPPHGGWLLDRQSNNQIKHTTAAL